MNQITTKDLRIGNMVNLCFHHKPGWFPAAVTAMYASSIDTDTDDSDSREYYYEGIPLTEEWLVRMGFEKREGNTFKNISLPYWVNNAVVLFFNESPPENTYLLALGFNVGNDLYAATINWIDAVHQLQNGYFVLRQEELKLA